MSHTVLSIEEVVSVDNNPVEVPSTRTLCHVLRRNFGQLQFVTLLPSVPPIIRFVVFGSLLCLLAKHLL